MQQITDPYRALGVARAATDAEIKAAHRKLVKRYHPDTGSKSDTERFLRVQEAYRVLADPLARKEWDLKHAPGPVRADRSAGTTTRRRRPAAPRAPEAEPAETPPPPRERPQPADPRTQPRSSRAYTWSASEVPWWEEAGTRTEKRPPRQRPAPEPAEPSKSTEPAAPKQPDEPLFTQPDMDVYNRSSGAAWSMAARAYFRKGDAELPNRGAFHHQGTQVVTAGRARSAAEAEARRRAAAASAQADAPAPEAAAAHAGPAAPAPPTASSTAAAAETAKTPRPAAQPAAAAPRTERPRTYAAASPSAGTTRIVRRSIAVAWPTLGNRFAYALVAWLPLVAVASLLFADTLDPALTTLVVGLVLVLLIVLPRLAYVAAVATVLALVVGGLFVGGLLLAGRLPGLDSIGTFIGGLLAVAYLATAAVIAIGPHTLRPWSVR